MATLTTARTSYESRYSDNVYFRDGHWLTGVLIALLYLIVAASLDAAGYVTSITIILPVTAGSLALGFLMAFSRFDGFFALSHSLFTGLAWILFLMSTMVTRQEIAPFVDNGIGDLQAKSYFVLLRWLNWIDAAFNNTASADNYVFVFEICFLVWWLTYLGVWAIVRYGYVWRAVVPAGVVLLINTYYAPKSVLGFLVVFSLVAMILFVRTNLAEQQLRWREQRVHFSDDIVLDFLRNGFIYSVIILAMAWVAPGLGRSFQVRTVLAPINERWQETTERWNRLYQGLNRQTRPVSATFGRTLSLGGARNVGDKVVFKVDAPIGRYWRAVVYDTYTGRQWFSSAEQEERLRADQPVAIANWQMRQPLTQTITLALPTGNMIFGAPDILRASVPMVALVQSLPALPMSAQVVGTDQPLPQAVEIAMARSRTDLEVGRSYSVVSQYTAATVRALQNANTDYPQAFLDQFTQLPENVSPRVVELAQTLASGRETVYDKAKTIETYLRDENNYTYNDDIAAPPPDKDPVEYFLFDIKQGYCDYYATAMTVMLRSLGIPARLASGYAEGDYDEESLLFFISERDAHTWVEVYFPEYGWIEFEPTGGGPNGESPLERPIGEDATGEAAGSTGSAAVPGPQDPGYDPLLSTQPENLDDLLGDTGALNQTAAARFRWIGALLTAILLIAGVWLAWRARFAGPTVFDPNLPPAIFDRLQQWAERLGQPQTMGQTPYEEAHLFARRLPQGKPHIQTITDIYVRHRFSRRPSSTLAASAQARTGQMGVRLLDSWRQLRPLLWKAWFRKMLRFTARRKKDPFMLVNE